jgi:hypothetical protein
MNEKKIEQEAAVEYTKPEVRDYGDLGELTAFLSTGPLTDVPLGQPASFMS